MELRDLLVCPKTVEFRGLTLTYNANAFTPDFLRKAARSYRDTYKPLIDAAAFEDESAVNGEGEKKKTADEKKAAALANIENFAYAMESNAGSLEADRAIFAALLPGTEDCPVLMEWDLTRDGQPVPITEEELLKLTPEIVTDMWKCVRDAASPKSQEIPPTSTSPTISAPTNARSSSQATQTVPDLSM